LRNSLPCLRKQLEPFISNLNGNIKRNVEQNKGSTYFAHLLTRLWKLPEVFGAAQRKLNIF